MIDANKKSWIQDGAFNFYTPDGNLLNPTEMTPNTDGVMNKDVTYHAEENEDAIRDFFEFAVKDLEGTDSPKEYWQAVTDWQKAGRDLWLANWRFGIASYNFTEAEGAKDRLEENVSALEDEIKDAQPKFDEAYNSACNLADIAFNEFKTSIESNKDLENLKELFDNAPVNTVEKYRLQKIMQMLYIRI